jgi:hypothetical protein
VSVEERDADGEETGERRVLFRTVFVFDSYLVLGGTEGGVGRSTGDELPEATCVGAP